MSIPAYSFVDMNSWSRAADFDFFIAADSQMRICADVEVGPLRVYAREHDLRFFHCVAYMVARCINEIDVFRLSAIHHPTEADPRVPILYERRDLSYPVLNEAGNPVNLVVGYDPDFEVFYPRSIAAADAAARENVNTFTENDAHFILTYLPIHFTDLGMTSTKMRMQMPAVGVGKYEQEDDGCKMPVSLAYAHAFADGMQLVRFYEMLESLCCNPAAALGRGV